MDERHMCWRGWMHVGVAAKAARSTRPHNRSVGQLLPRHRRSPMQGISVGRVGGFLGLRASQSRRLLVCVAAPPEAGWGRPDGARIACLRFCANTLGHGIIGQGACARSLPGLPSHRVRPW